MKQDSSNKRNAERNAFSSKIEFFVCGDVEEATSVDISATGLRFASSRPMQVRMRTRTDGKLKEYLAELVWAKRNDAGDMEYGFRFLPDEPDQEF